MPNSNARTKSECDGDSTRNKEPASSRWRPTCLDYGTTLVLESGTQADDTNADREVTLLKSNDVTVHIRFKAGCDPNVVVATPQTAWMKHRHFRSKTALFKFLSFSRMVFLRF
jgi:hypothetical protein